MQLYEVDDDADGNVDSRRTTSYDDVARTVREVTEVDGAIRTIRMTFLDESGRAIRTEGDDGGNGTIERVNTSVYGLDFIVFEDDDNNDGIVDSRASYTMNPHGNISRIEVDDDGDGTPEQIQTQQHEPANLFRAMHSVGRGDR